MTGKQKPCVQIVQRPLKIPEDLLRSLPTHIFLHSCGTQLIPSSATALLVTPGKPLLSPSLSHPISATPGLLPPSRRLRGGWSQQHFPPSSRLPCSSCGRVILPRGPGAGSRAVTEGGRFLGEARRAKGRRERTGRALEPPPLPIPPRTAGKAA